MADRATVRKQQKREKKRLKDQQRAGEARKKRRASLVKSPQKLIGLPLADCFISEHWHEQGPTIVAAVSRSHPNGRISAALFTVDLAQRGVTGAELVRDLDPEQLPSLLSRHGGESAVVECAPALVARAVSAGLALGTANDHHPPRGYAEAAVLLEGIDPADCPHEILTGPAEAPAEPEEKSPGLLAGLKKRLGL
jgi:hypothetical protein